MLDEEILRVKVDGDFACFTRPDLKVERMSYPCMTPSAARGVLDSILWKPEFQWWVRRILIIEPIQFLSIKKNEINSKQRETPIVVDEMKKDNKPKYRAQRSSIVLKKVSYIIEASIFRENFERENPPRKYAEMFKRRVRKGQCWRRPFLGTREFAAEFTEPTGRELPIDETVPIGGMLFDIFFNAEGKPEPLFFFDAAIKNGVLECPVEANKKMRKSTHIRPPADAAFNTAVYDFNRLEEAAL